MFVGPVLTVPLMLLATYGIAFGPDLEVPIYMRVIMSFSYLRYGLEGLMSAMYGYGREDTICPDGETFCLFSKADYLKSFLGFNDADYFVSMVALFMYYALFTGCAFLMIRMRLATNASNYVAVQYLNYFVKKYLNFSTYKY